MFKLYKVNLFISVQAKPYLLFILLIIYSLPAKPQAPATVLTGAERMDIYLPALTNKKVGMVVNQTSVVGKTHLVDTLLSRQIRITGIYAPEHG